MFNICGIFRNNHQYLSSVLLPELRQVVPRYPGTKFYFYENDSFDNTHMLLRKFIGNHQGRLITESTTRVQHARSESFERIDNLSTCRNILLSAKPFDTENQWTIMIDSDIYFNRSRESQPGSLLKLLNKFNAYKQDYSVDTVFIGCNGKHGAPCDTHGESGCLQYYDTYPLILRDGEWGHHLSVTTDRTCNWFQHTKDRDDWEQNKPVRVNSAFGGMAFIRTDILNKHNVSYKPTTNNDKRILSEHVYFCKQLREYGSIYIDPRLKVYNYETAPPTKKPEPILKKKIWTMWLQGWDNIPDIMRYCYKSWKVKNPGWDMTLITNDNIASYIDSDNLEKIRQFDHVANQADLMRIYLLGKYGGMWTDSTNFCNKPLHEWVDNVAINHNWLHWDFDWHAPTFNFHYSPVNYKWYYDVYEQIVNDTSLHYGDYQRLIDRFSELMPVRYKKLKQRQIGQSSNNTRPRQGVKIIANDFKLLYEPVDETFKQALTTYPFFKLTHKGVPHRGLLKSLHVNCKLRKLLDQIL